MLMEYAVSRQLEIASNMIMLLRATMGMFGQLVGIATIAVQLVRVAMAQHVRL